MAKILLIEDEPKILEIYKSRFQEANHKIDTAPDGEEGLRKVNIFKPDIILLDILMPKMSGLEALKKLKSNEETKKIPVVLLTNVNGSEKNVQEGLNLGAEGYLVKASHTSKEVQEKVEKILKENMNKKGTKKPETGVAKKKDPSYDNDQEK